jgi:hypothetical protein
MTWKAGSPFEAGPSPFVNHKRAFYKAGLRKERKKAEQLLVNYVGLDKSLNSGLEDNESSKIREANISTAFYILEAPRPGRKADA